MSFIIICLFARLKAIKMGVLYMIGRILFRGLSKALVLLNGLLEVVSFV